MEAVKIENVSMRFNLARERTDSLKEFVVKKIKGQITFEEFWALKEVTFSVQKGEAVGLVGLNGSGKSTLLKIIAGVLKPTLGKAQVFGSVAPLIELGAGFDTELTARENVFLNGAVMGIQPKFMRKKLDEIIDFAELREFIDVPLKNFSSGMVARLGFSIATLVKADILIVDEILSVGDYLFKEKSEKRIAELMEGGTTVILVSHDSDAVRNICQRAIWLEKGQVIMDGESGEVCGRYEGKS